MKKKIEIIISIISVLFLMLMNEGLAREIKIQTFESTVSKNNFEKRIEKSDTNIYLIKGEIHSLEEKSVVPGVSVIIKGTSIGSVSDANGQFQLTYNREENGGLILLISFVGYKQLKKK